MPSRLLSLSLTGAILAAGVGLWSGAAYCHKAESPAELHRAQAVEERLALNFCYALYKSQTDVSRCLLRNTRS
jgi:hypothetical protein